MPLTYDLRVLLCIVGFFQVGQIWWCEDCEKGGTFKGGFVGDREFHRAGCPQLDT